jgi:sugar porter (SP) family MFS transporter
MRTGTFAILVALVGALGGLLFGYDTGVISGAILYIAPAFQLNTGEKEFVISIVLFGAMLGAFLAGGAADTYGRRTTLLGAGVLFTLGALASALAPPPNADVLVSARFVVGIAIGLSSVTAPLYISEAAPAASRGALVSLYQWAITIGILGAQIVDFLLAASKNWELMLGLAIVPSLLLVAGMAAMPESPRWLIAHGRIADGQAVLKRTRPAGEIAGALRDIETSLKVQEGSWRDLVRPDVRKALGIGIGLAVLQQITGINTVIYYGPQIFKLAGFSSDAVALLATIGVGAINVLLTVVAIAFIDRVGRKPLLYAGVTGMMLSLFALAYAFSSGVAASRGAITIASLMVYVGCFAFSLGPIVWLLISEIYPLRIRGRAMAIATLSNWAANFAVSLVFLSMIDLFGTSATFAIYGAMCVLTLFFVRFAVPETKAKELESISLRAGAA